MPPRPIPNEVTFEHNGVKKTTTAFLSDEALTALVARNARLTPLLNDMDDVHNIQDLRGISAEALQSLIAFGCCFNAEGHRITNVDASVEDVTFTIIHRPFFEHLGSIFSELFLLPMIGTQRLAMTDKKGRSRLDPATNRTIIDPYFQIAKRAAANCAAIPSFGYFTAEHIEGIREAVFAEIKQRFQDIRFLDTVGGMPAYVELAFSMHDIFERFNAASSKYKYLETAIQCLVMADKISHPFPNEHLGRYQRVIELVEQFDAIKMELSKRKATMSAPDFRESIRKFNDEGKTPENYMFFRQQVEAHLAVQPAFTEDNTAEETLLNSLAGGYYQFIDFATHAVGERFVPQFIEYFIATNSHTLGILTRIREMYIKFMKDTGSSQAEKDYFKAVWNAHLDYVRETYQVVEDNHVDNESLETRLQDLRKTALSLGIDEEIAEKIEGDVNLKNIQNLYSELFTDFLTALTNGSKQIIAEAIKNYLRGLGVAVTDECSLADDKASYGETFEAGPFVHADIQGLFTAARGLRNQRREVELDDLIKPEMLDPHLQQLLLFRPPMMVLAMIAMRPVELQENEKLLAYKKKAAVTSVNHPLFDAAIVACLKSASAAELQAFKGILANLVTQAEGLTTDPIYCNRFAAQFFQYMVSGALNNLPPIAHLMLHQAQVMNPDISLSFLLARLLKAICSDIKAFCPEVSADTQQLFQAVAQSFGMIGLQEENVLKAYGAYDPALVTHINTMVNASYAHEQIDNCLSHVRLGNMPLRSELASFIFDKRQEIHFVPRGYVSNIQVYDQLFGDSREGGVEALAGHRLFAEFDRSNYPTTVWAVGHPGCLLVNDKGMLSSDIGSKMSDPVATVTISLVDSFVKVVLDAPGAVGFNYLQNRTQQKFYSLIVSEEDANLLGNPPPAPIEVVYAAIERHAKSLKLDELSQLYYRNMAITVANYLQDRGGITRDIFLDALRVLFYLDDQNRDLQPGTFEPIEGVLKIIANPNPGSLAVTRLENKRFIGKLSIGMVAAAVLGATVFGGRVSDPQFVEYVYNLATEKFLNDYLFPIERVAIAGGYAWYLSVCLDAALKAWGKYKQAKATQEQADIQNLTEISPLMTVFERAEHYLGMSSGSVSRYQRLGFDEEGMQELRRLHEGIKQHQDGGYTSEIWWWTFKREAGNHGANMVFVKDRPSWEVYAVNMMKFIKRLALVAPLAGIYFVILAARAYQSSVVEEVGDDVMKTIERLAALLGGRYGLFFLMPLITIIRLLPDDLFIRMARAPGALYECVAHDIPAALSECAGSVGQTIQEARLPRWNFFRRQPTSRDDVNINTPLLQGHDSDAVYTMEEGGSSSLPPLIRGASATN